MGLDGGEDEDGHREEQEASVGFKDKSGNPAAREEGLRSRSSVVLGGDGIFVGNPAGNLGVLIIGIVGEP
jgi:hypothetical protein